MSKNQQTIFFSGCVYKKVQCWWSCTHNAYANSSMWSLCHTSSNNLLVLTSSSSLDWDKLNIFRVSVSWYTLVIFDREERYGDQDKEQNKVRVSDLSYSRWKSGIGRLASTNYSLYEGVCSDAVRRENPKNSKSLQIATHGPCYRRPETP